MSDSLTTLQAHFVKQFDQWLEDYLIDCQKLPDYSSLLLKSQSYSLHTGGKRFRPFLAYLIFKLFSDENIKIKNLCLSLEMVHTYSLIHDDLPCMDNDDIRRGQPTNHKVFKEDTALLAGDGLLSDVFGILAMDPHSSPEVRVKIIALLSEKIGSFGMVSGQVKDMQANNDVNINDLKTIHTLKTANLIQAAAVGAALVAEASETELHNISEFSQALGMAFQIKDDLLDYNDKEQDFKSYVKILGLEKTKNELQNYSNSASSALNKFGDRAQYLKQLIDYNLQRTI